MSGLMGHLRFPNKSDVLLWGESSPLPAWAVQPAKSGETGVLMRSV